MIPVRYIRDWLDGSSLSSSNSWVEIQATSATGSNVAAGKAVSSSLPGNFAQGYVTDGVTVDTNQFVIAGPVPPQYVVIDLGSVRTDIISITTWHRYSGSARTWHGTRLDVSADGASWTTIFNSQTSGEYIETASGNTSYLPVNMLVMLSNTGEYFAPSRNPSRPQISPTPYQFAARSAGGVMFSFDSILDEQLFTLSWTRISYADASSLRSFFSLMDGMSTEFTMFDPWAQASTAVSFASTSIDVTETSPGGYSASCQIRRVMA
jgi:hypothetical protein